MSQINLSELNIEKIKKGEFEESIPELYELKEIIENNKSHINDPVFTHTISVLTELEQLLKRVNEKVKGYLSQKIDYYSRQELLFLAAVFHDIAKKETLNKEGDISKFPGHEEASAEKFSKISSRFDLSEKEKEIIIQIIKNHGFFHGALDGPKDGLDKKIIEFREESSNIFLEVILLTIADILGNQMKEKNFEEFNFRIKFLNKIIKNY